MFWSQVFLVVNTGSEHFLGVGHDVGPVLQLEMLVAPHLPCSSTSSLDLVYDQLDVMFATESLEASEPRKIFLLLNYLVLLFKYLPVTGAVVISTFSLYWLSDDTFDNYT